MGSEGQKVKAKGMDSFGREDEADRAVLERLAKSISQFLY
ncbi:hypothetical protein B4113_4103 [Geobacillus sp. B4113_201601]|nr:hypothetical protein B4113_4103 [Geobacillus sp. B4113_201601]